MINIIAPNTCIISTRVIGEKKYNVNNSEIPSVIEQVVMANYKGVHSISVAADIEVIKDARSTKPSVLFKLETLVIFKSKYCAKTEETLDTIDKYLTTAFVDEFYNDYTDCGNTECDADCANCGKGRE